MARDEWRTEVVVGPVDWGAHGGGEFLEEVMAVFVAQDHPDALRRTPSSGDGGVDILVQGENGWDVLQVKGFSHRLGDDQRRQIAHSWKTFCDDPRLKGPIEAWRLVCPIDLTSGEKEWFDQLTAGASHDVSYRGRVYWNVMAAKHPHVVDYYFGGGQARVAQRSKTLLSAFEDPRNPLSPDDAIASLEMLRAQLSREDPHYRYEFLTGDEPPGIYELPDCVVAQTQSVQGGGCVTLMLHAKHRHSTEDSPIEGRFVLTSPSVEANDIFHEAVDGFLTFGRSLELETGVEFEMSGPLGVDSDLGLGGIRIQASVVEGGAKNWRLGCDDPDGNSLAEVALYRDTLTRGPAGGAELILKDAHGLMSFTMQVRPRGDDSSIAADVNINVASEMSNHPAVHTVGVAELHSHLHPPNRIVLRGEFGDEPLISEPLRDDSMALHDSQLEIIRMLARLQPLTREPVLVPEDVTEDLFKEVRHELTMLDGNATSGTWSLATIELDPDEEALPRLEEGQTPHVSFDQERRITVGDVEIPLGVYRTRFAFAQLDPPRPGDPNIVLRPAEDDTYEMTRLGDKGSTPEGIHIETESA